MPQSLQVSGPGLQGVATERDSAHRAQGPVRLVIVSSPKDTIMNYTASLLSCSDMFNIVNFAEKHHSTFTAGFRKYVETSFISKLTLLKKTMTVIQMSQNW